MIYTYRCYDCEHEFDASQSIKDAPLKKCPNCKHLSIERVIYPPIIFSKREPTTIGQLADRNSKKLGKAEISERENKRKAENKPAMDQARVELNRKLASKTEAQKQRYIEDGRI